MENEKLNTPQNPPLQQTAVIGCALIDLEFTIKTQRKPTYFSRWMNLVNNFV